MSTDVAGIVEAEIAVMRGIEDSGCVAICLNVDGKLTVAVETVAALNRNLAWKSHMAIWVIKA